MLSENLNWKSLKDLEQGVLEKLIFVILLELSLQL